MSRIELLKIWERKLKSHLPPGSEKTIAHWIVDLHVDFVISKPRKTKLGDFRPKHNGKRARITINNDLNPYQFLITTVHEFAHLGCHLKHGNRVAPHGDEWKSVYKELLNHYIAHHPIDGDLTLAIKRHLAKPSASSCSCDILTEALSKYDDDPGFLLDSLQSKQHFFLHGVEYVIENKRRTRYLCTRVDDGKKYLISGRAKVDLVTSLHGA